MIDIKKLVGLSKEDQLDLIRCKVEVARRALELSKDQSDEVQQVLKEYLAHAEQTLEKASWSLK